MRAQRKDEGKGKYVIEVRLGRQPVLVRVNCAVVYAVVGKQS